MKHNCRIMELKPELKRHLLNKVKEELEDIISYDQMYKEALSDGNRRLARIINRIAEDEYEHAEYLCAYLKDHGAYTTEEHNAMAELWKSVDRIFNDE